jgi:hypothetical protein
LIFVAAELLISSLFIRRRLMLQRVNSQVASRHPILEMAGSARRETRMLWTVFAILLLLWLLGWGFHVAGSLIHLILVIALVVLLVEVITGRRAAI